MAMKNLLAISAVGVSLAMAGCAAIADADPEADQCGAEALQDRIGEPATGTTAEDLTIGGEPVEVTANAVRVVGPGDAMTMDFREDRLTIEVDEDGNLETARCV